MPTASAAAPRPSAITMLIANGDSWLRSLRRRTSMCDSPFERVFATARKSALTQKMRPRNKRFIRRTNARKPASEETPTRANSSTTASIANAIRSFTNATETMALPRRLWRRFRSRRIRTLTGRAVTARAVARNRARPESHPRERARPNPNANGRRNSTYATTMLRSRNACRSPSRPSSIPARSTSMRIPRLATTPSDCPGSVRGLGSMRPRTMGPRRMPARTSPIIGDCPIRSIASPASLVAVKRNRRATMRSNATPHAVPSGPIHRYIFLRAWLSQSMSGTSGSAGRILKGTTRSGVRGDGPQGQAPRRMQRLGLRRLAWRVLSAEHPEAGVPEDLFRRLRLRRGRFVVLQDPGTRDDEGLVPHRSPRVPVHDEDAEAHHAREEAEGRDGKPGLVLRVREGVEGEVRAARRAAPPVDQVRFPLDADAGLREGV